MLEDNVFIEQVLPGAIMRNLTEAEMTHYRAPFINPGEDRRPTLTWPRQLPIDGEPEDVVAIVQSYGEWLSRSPAPKLFINADPGAILRGAQREFLPHLARTDRGDGSRQPFHPGRLAR